MFDARFNYTASSLTPSQVAANTTAEQTFSNIPRVEAGNVVLAVNKPTAQAGLGIVGARVTGDGQIAITFVNATASPITPTAAETYDFFIAKKQPSL